MANITSIILLLGLVLFWGVSLYNVLKYSGTSHTQFESPLSLEFLLALLGTLFMFAETLAYVATRLLDASITIHGTMSKIGVFIFLSGCFLHAWSVRVRGKYSVSWTMPEDHKLIKSAPYSFVRHPSYLGYMLMIIGVTLIWRKWFTLFPWVAIPGYFMVSRREEQLLIKHFGDEYREYMEKVGGFIPKI
ncbi:methyltransferase family protein [Thermoproteota archaeon]